MLNIIATLLSLTNMTKVLLMYLAKHCSPMKAILLNDTLPCDCKILFLCCDDPLMSNVHGQKCLSRLLLWPTERAKGNTILVLFLGFMCDLQLFCHEYWIWWINVIYAWSLINIKNPMGTQFFHWRAPIIYFSVKQLWMCTSANLWYSLCPNSTRLAESICVPYLLPIIFPHFPHFITFHKYFPPVSPKYFHLPPSQYLVSLFASYPRDKAAEPPGK